MGLDISVYSSSELAAPIHEFEECCWKLGHVHPYVNPDFPERADGMDGRCRIATSAERSFRAGSYSGYNAWRDELARFAGFKSDADAWENARSTAPFWELLNFSDCEGIIGPVTSAKLARDFRENLSRAEQHQDDWWKKKYREWMEAFESVTATGFVLFH